MGDGRARAGRCGARPIARLSKRHVELLLDGYDADPVGALTAALRVVLQRPDHDWPALIDAAPLDADRRAHLLECRQPALDDLLRELNELRTLG